MTNIPAYNPDAGHMIVLPKGSSVYSFSADEQTDDSVYACRGICSQHTGGAVVESNPFSPDGIIYGPGYQPTVDDQDRQDPGETIIIGPGVNTDGGSGIITPFSPSN